MILMTISFLLFLSRKARNFHHRFASARNKSSSSSARQYTRGRRFGENQSKSSSFSLLLVPLFLRPPRAFFYDDDVKSCSCVVLKACFYIVVVFDTFPLSPRVVGKRSLPLRVVVCSERRHDTDRFGLSQTLNTGAKENPFKSSSRGREISSQLKEIRGVTA